MNETFEASNGVKLDEYGEWVCGNIHSTEEEENAARIEFYQHLRDKELGRWRWPENPDYVVYKAPAGERVPDARHVTVSNESNGEAAWLFEVGSGGVSGGVSWARDAARAYFAAHPEPKPWDEAEDGEVWALTGAGGLEQPFRRLNGKWLSCTPNAVEYSAKHAIDGRRIWPVPADG